MAIKLERIAGAKQTSNYVEIHLRSGKISSTINLPHNKGYDTEESMKKDLQLQLTSLIDILVGLMVEPDKLIEGLNP